MKNSLSVKRLKQVLHYEPITGAFTWLISPNRRIKVGSVAGAASNGYLMIGIDGGHYLAHRLAWVYVTGKWPSAEIDHKDRNRSNNAFSNLREATRKQNSENKPVRATNNTSGARGVSFHRRFKRWRAFIGHNGTCRHLGYFNTEAEARAARSAAEALLFTHA